MKTINYTTILFILFSTTTYGQNTDIKMSKNVPNSVEIIDNHLDQFFDEDSDIKVFDEIESELIHRDVYFIKATEERQYHILLSCGMSALPMTVPKDIASSEFIEIMILLPKEWNLEYESFSEEKNYWPIRIMKEIMMLPHENETWFGFGHTYGHEEDEELAEGIGFNSIMLASSMELSDEFTQIELDNGKVVEIYTLIPLYKEELEFKKKNGASALLEKFDKFGIEEIVKIGRKNVCK
ncbi:suppressor of fused domain protein [Flavobacterium lacus]|uniref:Suppressor of fused protein SUFU n=1 Tax=Flavobacterium lacus TaxID=1353778 RepID=A0A328WKR9_9FLAO|nr:suppressor of fused domain protein [Flavobacterium lacus]RAR46803.1 suppressor of fused protein SUFU [Flavobacterium lacus]